LAGGVHAGDEGLGMGWRRGKQAEMATVDKEGNWREDDLD
jgi:hypothetical protein